MWRVLSNILCNHDPNVKVKSEEAGICNDLPSTAVKLKIMFVIAQLKHVVDT